MSVIETLTQRNEAFASSRFSAELKIMPSMKTMIFGCVDPRVDPVDIFSLAPGEAAVIRNVGGRITPATLQKMAMLGIVPKASGDTAAGGNLILLHPNNSGITRPPPPPRFLANSSAASPATPEP